MIEKGKVLTLANGKEYICIQTTVINNENYLYLISNNKPVEVKAVYNPAIDGYDYSEPGTVIEKDLEESELDDQHTLSKTY